MSNILHSQEAGGAVLAHVAGNLRALRTAAGLSQAQLAERSGLSRRMLVALEGGDTNISLARLSRVAEALNVSFARLVREPEVPGRPPARAVVWGGVAPDSRAELLGAAPVTREAEFWLWSLAPGERYQAEADPPGWREAIFVCEGTLVLDTAEGEERVTAGGFTILRSDQSYAYVNVGPGLLRFIGTVLM